MAVVCLDEWHCWLNLASLVVMYGGFREVSPLGNSNWEILQKGFQNGILKRENFLEHTVRTSDGEKGFENGIPTLFKAVLRGSYRLLGLCKGFLPFC